MSPLSKTIQSLRWVWVCNWCLKSQPKLPNRLHHQPASWLCLRRRALRSTSPFRFHHRKFLFPWPRQEDVPFTDSNPKTWLQPPWSSAMFSRQALLRPRPICENRQISFVDFRITWIPPFLKNTSMIWKDQGKIRYLHLPRSDFDLLEVVSA